MKPEDYIDWMKKDNEIYMKYRGYLDTYGYPEWESNGCHVHLVFGACGWAIDTVEPPFDDYEQFEASELHDHVDDYVAEAIIQKDMRERIK